MGHHISLRHLRYVIAAAEQGTFRRAAQALGVQELAISRRIRDLEDEIGAALFIRHHGGVELTYAGQVFLGRAQKAISHIGHAERDVGAVGREELGVVRIGIFSSLASGFLAELFQAYDAGHAGSTTSVNDGEQFDGLFYICQLSSSISDTPKRLNDMRASAKLPSQRS